MGHREFLWLFMIDVFNFGEEYKGSETYVSSLRSALFHKFLAWFKKEYFTVVNGMSM